MGNARDHGAVGGPDRAARERRHYDRGLDRRRYDDVLAHATRAATRRRWELLAPVMAVAAGRDVLELGSQSWVNFLERPGVRPARLCCINISEVELAKGRALATGASIAPSFVLMDATRLAFPDGTFDVVFGSSILHHLDMAAAVDEIHRVLRPGGTLVFSEPLGINPAGRLVRRFTPRARTADERPFGLADLRLLRSAFEVELSYEQLLTVPAGLVSRALFREPDNALMRAALRVDESLARRAPPLGLLYRRVLVVGRRR